MRRHSLNLLAFTLLFASIASLYASNLNAKEPPVSDKAAEVVEGNNAFALDLYDHLKDTQGNLFFSPYSISTALAMTAAGARTTTLQEMTATLHLPQDPHEAFKGLIEKSTDRKGSLSHIN